MAWLGLTSLAFGAERTTNPTEAAVFIRVVGTVEVKVDSAWTERESERNVELGTGTGFVFTEYGHVITNHHVVSGDLLEGRLRTGGDVEVRLAVDRIEVVFPSGTVDPDVEGPEVMSGDVTRAGLAQAYEATLEVSDPELDLAVLSIGGADLPYLAFGDSDAAEAGDAVGVYGFPFGRKLELGRLAREGNENGNPDDIVPSVTVTRGTMSATRVDDFGGAAFLQTSATVNPGNSGGPMVDAEGFVLGVIRLKLRDGDGVGFAIPVNRVKDFLDFNGYGSLLPTERLRLGGQQTFPDKGLALALPEVMEDRSPSRLSVFSDPAARANGVLFFAERVVSPWPLSRLHELLLAGDTFGGFRADGEQKSQAYSAGRLIVGRASGVDGPTGSDAKLEYTLFDAGYEKVLVRYDGTAEAIAFNRSALKESLASAEVSPLLTEEVAAPIAPEGLPWIARPLPVPGHPSVEVPEPWVYETSPPFFCEDLAPVSSALAASPLGDFTVSLRVGFREGGGGPEAARRACHPDAAAGSLGAASYAYAVDWLGVRYAVEGVFLERDGGLLQLERVAPTDKASFVTPLAHDFFERNDQGG